MKEGESLGLLGRASTIKASRAREQARGSAPPSSQAGGLVATAKGVDSSGIDDADRLEIAQRLDEVAKANRLPTDPALLTLRAGKRGFVLPLVVNIAAVLLVAASVYLFSLLFSRQEASVAGNGTALNSAEGRLLAELKRDSAARLEAKNKEIEEIQARMQSLDKEVSSLSASFETRIKTKETELKTKLAAELDVERKRLQAEGLSEAVIQERLKSFEVEKTREFQGQLAAFKTAAETERLAAEANYAKLRKEFEANAAGLAAERKRLEEEAAKKEEELRASLAAELARKNAAATTQAQAGTEALEAAKAELSRLAEEKRKSSLAEEALVGLYGGIRQDLAQANYASALAKADSLRAYLQEPSVAALPGLAGRREADLFAADSLGNLAKLQLDKTKADAGLLLKQAEAYEGARKAAEEGHQALAAGDSVKAEQAYLSALSLLPPILEAHQYFVSRAEATEALRRKNLGAALDRGAVAFDQGEYDGARAAYLEALDYLPLDAQGRKDFLDKMESTATKLSAMKRQASETRAARAAAASAKASLEAGRWEEAYAAYVGILSRLPASQQAEEAADGASRAMRGLAQAQVSATEAASQSQAELRWKIDGLMKDIEDLKQAQAEALRMAKAEGNDLVEALRQEKDATIAQLQARLTEVEASTLASQNALPEAKAQAEASLARAAAAEERAGQLEARALAAEKALSEAEASLAGAESALAEARASLAKLAPAQTEAPLVSPPTLADGDLQAALASLRTENEALNLVSARHEALKRAYADYATREDELLASGDPGAATDAYGNLLAFASSEAVKEAFPGFSTRIERNWQAFQSSLSSNSLADASEICLGLVAILKVEDGAERRAKVEDLRAEYGRQPAMLVFLDKLADRLGLGKGTSTPAATPVPASGGSSSLPEPAVVKPALPAPAELAPAEPAQTPVPPQTATPVAPTESAPPASP